MGPPFLNFYLVTGLYPKSMSVDKLRGGDTPLDRRGVGMFKRVCGYRGRAEVRPARFVEPTRRNIVKFGLFYQMPCADTQSEPMRYQETIEQIVHADTLGFDCAWLAELHFFKP